ncbi:ABC transporter substrate-binding protein [Halogeometricum borinquense]|uniref:ABC transporter substrate-binding protein n=1 Tax=Halogeometricum borinquense TaxID=60847 RepID=A0A482T0T8_9EURY|nr:ABC transporter substrate-binding protein [Halogeometricum borinquense]
MRMLRETSTRRDVLKGGSALIGSGFLAGCTSSGQSTPPSDSTSSDSSRGTSTDTATTEQSYSVSLDPVGTIPFEQPPETVVSGWGFVGDVLMALGQADRIVGMSRPGFWFQGFYELLPGVSMRDTTAIPNTVSKGYSLNEELLYELDPDLLATDPNRFIAWYGSDTATVEPLVDDIAPFFGNESRSKRPSGWPNWPTGEDYDYYAIPEFVERYGQVFQEQKRATAMVDLYETTLDDITSRLPPLDERPTVGVLSAFTNPENSGHFGVSNPIPALDATHELKHYGDLGVVDAFAEQYGEERGHYDLTVGFEGLLAVDPDVLIFDEAVNALGGQTVYGNTKAYERTLELLRTDDIGQRLTAVQNDRLYPGGTGSQGPIINLFQTEMLAKQLYPAEFGPWRGLGETPTDEQLFDRQRVADIINGDL